MQPLHLLFLLGSACGFLASAGGRPQLLARARPCAMADPTKFIGDDSSFDFGDAGAVSAETTQVLEQEEVEMTEKQKEIARLRAAEKFMKKETGNAQCTVCSYKYFWKEEDPTRQVPKNTPYSVLPDNYACPQCKAPKAFFEPELIEIAGFEDNQNYGIGSNTWTEAQKSNAIFGGLGFLFLLLLSGYALN